MESNLRGGETGRAASRFPGYAGKILNDTGKQLVAMLS